MSCRAEAYALGPDVRLRPVPELGACLAYTPARRRLHRLNAAGWLLATLCDGSPVEAIEAAYCDALRRAGGTPEPGDFREGLASLVALGVVGRVAHSDMDKGDEE